MTIPDLGVTPYGADGRAEIELETYERTLPDGTVRTIQLNPRDPDECWFTALSDNLRSGRRRRRHTWWGVRGVHSRVEVGAPRRREPRRGTGRDAPLELSARDLHRLGGW
ncbi:hypothetical protein GCM10009680_43240 [Streptomyces yatensis]|uniref:Uncharacterized protein n=1 Tax=Streptomyces yatensis TaxID=155177 RepID=A0ABP4U714_9ACTN